MARPILFEALTPALKIVSAKIRVFPVSLLPLPLRATLLFSGLIQEKKVIISVIPGMEKDPKNRSRGLSLEHFYHVAPRANRRVLR